MPPCAAVFFRELLAFLVKRDGLLRLAFRGFGVAWARLGDHWRSRNAVTKDNLAATTTALAKYRLCWRLALSGYASKKRTARAAARRRRWAQTGSSTTGR